MTQPPVQCSKLIPPQLVNKTEGAALPDFSLADTLKTQGDDLGSAKQEAILWQVFGLNQSGQLEKANNDKPSIVYIYSTCESLYNEARPRKKFLGIF